MSINICFYAKNIRFSLLCAHTAVPLHRQKKKETLKLYKDMDIFIMAVRILGVMAEIKEKTHKVFG